MDPATSPGSGLKPGVVDQPANIARARRVVILPARLETKKHCTLG